MTKNKPVVRFTVLTHPMNESWCLCTDVRLSQNIKTDFIQDVYGFTLLSTRSHVKKVHYLLEEGKKDEQDKLYKLKYILKLFRYGCKKVLLCQPGRQVVDDVHWITVWSEPFRWWLDYVDLNLIPILSDISTFLRCTNSSSFYCNRDRVLNSNDSISFSGDLGLTNSHTRCLVVVDVGDPLTIFTS